MSLISESVLSGVGRKFQVKASDNTDLIEE